MPLCVFIVFCFVSYCRNGSGRTGAFIAISSNIDRAKSDNSVDVFQTVKMMRIQRMGCVQTTVSQKNSKNMVWMNSLYTLTGVLNSLLC